MEETEGMINTGLKNLHTVRALSKLTQIENPPMVFLMKTKLREVEMDMFRQKCGFKFLLRVSCVSDSREKAGGLALLWTTQVKITITSYSLHYMGFL